MSIRKKFIWICLVLLVLAVFSGCMAEEPTPSTTVPPIEEKYEYTTQSDYFYYPSLVDNWIGADALTVDTEDGTFFCLTADSTQADGFINAQRTLLRFLRANGMETGKLTYYAVNCDDSFSESGKQVAYDGSFSESSKEAAYIDLSAAGSWQQVLVTLQALWGDYTDYGYVYAMSNAIAGKLGWQAEPVPDVEKTSMDAFFSENPAAVNLLYPTFTTEYASEETVDCCKGLSRRLFEEINLHTALSKPITAQLDDYYVLVSAYAKELGLSFTRQTCGYACYSQRVPLRILTAYAEFLVDDNFSDYYDSIYEDYFSDYESIFQTANTIDAEITAAVEYFGLENEAGVVTIKWMSGDSAKKKFGNGIRSLYHVSAQTIYTTTVTHYLSEYYEHIAYLLNPDLVETWQTQAFCEIGNANSQYELYRMETIFTQDAQIIELFYSCTGRSYQPGKDDYYEVSDIHYYTYGHDLKKNNYGPILSISHYLIDLYGENAFYSLMLFPETAESFTGKTWEEWEAEWKQHIQEKYAGVEIPDLE